MSTGFLIAAILAGAALGVGLAATVGCWWLSWRHERATCDEIVGQAADLLEDVEAEDHDEAEVLALFRARAALYELGRVIAARKAGAR